jgi:acyl-CoA thioester hydrolase
MGRIIEAFLQITRKGAYLTALAGCDIDFKSLILAELTITVRSPAFPGGTIQVGGRVAEIRNSRFILESQIEEQRSGRLLALARAVVVHYDYTANRAKPVPKEWREAISRLEQREL